MTPREISAAYAALHERWPELRPDGIIFQQDRWVDIPSEVEGDGPREHIAHAACFLACLKACADRGYDVSMMTGWNVAPKAYNTVNVVHVNIAHPHTITAVMDRVMQLPKVNA